jgi:hypothetical protein
MLVNTVTDLCLCDLNVEKIEVPLHDVRVNGRHTAYTALVLGREWPLRRP